MQNVPAVTVPRDPLLTSYLHTAWNESNRTLRMTSSWYSVYSTSWSILKPSYLAINNNDNKNNIATYNQFHNILRLFDVLPNFPLTTSETMGDYYLYTWYKRAVLWVAERLKT